MAGAVQTIPRKATQPAAATTRAAVAGATLRAAASVPRYMVSDATAGAVPVAASGAASRPASRSRNPHQEIAPAIAAVRHRAGYAARHPEPDKPVAKAEASGFEPAREATRAADRATVSNVQTAAQNAEKVQRSFKDKLKETLDKAINSNMQQPKTKKEADALVAEGAKRANDSLGGQLTSSREATVGPVQQAVANPVQPGSADPAPPLHVEQTGTPPAPVSAQSAIPPPLPPERLDMSSDRAPTEQEMAKNDITQQQLEEGNDPAFGPATSARSDAEKHEAKAEGQYRQTENAERTTALGVANQALVFGLAAMQGTRGTKIGHVGAQQVSTKDKNIAAKNAVTERIAGIKRETLDKVNETLAGLEDTATSMFERGLQRAEAAYDAAFKEAKGGAWTWLTTWGDDWTEHIENSLKKAKSVYKAEVSKAIDEVADYVDEKLTAAKNCVADGLKRVETFVDGLDSHVKEFAQAALKEVSGDFEKMVEDIDSRADKIVDKLAEQYRASNQRMEAREEELREENKSLWQKVYDATVGLIKKILAFKDMLLDILARAASVIGDIIKHPIRFLGNLIDAVKSGIDRFVSKIGEHLKKGLMEWLFGTLAGAGITLPKSFDIEGIIGLALQILGLTYANFRARAVALLGEKVVSTIETVAEVFKKLATEGPIALWEWIKEKVGDLKTMILGQIMDLVITKVITAGVTWLIGLLNPASAFFKACKAIYDIIMFFVTRGDQIIALVNAVIDSIASIAAGAIDSAAAKVEDALARAIPVVIGFLASLLGVGDLGEKIKGIIEKIRKPINEAIDWVIGKAKMLVGNVFGGKDSKDGTDGKDERTEEQRTQDKLAGIAEAEKLVTPENFEPEKVRAGLGAIKTRHRLLTLDLVIDARSEQSETVHFTASASSAISGPPKTVTIAVGAAGAALTPGSWIQIVSDGSFEQVSSGASVVRRGAAGAAPLSFSTARAAGGTATRSYAAENTEWKRTNFVHGSKLVMPIAGAKFALKPAYQDGDYIRTKFYTDSSSSRAAIVSARLPSLAHPTDPKSFLSEAPASLEAAKGYTQQLSGRAIVPNAVASADHDPPISAHWTSHAGNNVNQTKRVNWNSALGSYKIMSVSANLSLSSRGATYTDTVGINFRGPGEP